jgi:hypothetical protein
VASANRHFILSERFVVRVAFNLFTLSLFLVMAQSVEPMIADLSNNWLKSYGLDYKLEQESLNSEIDKALKNYESKSG